MRGGGCGNLDVGCTSDNISGSILNSSRGDYRAAAVWENGLRKYDGALSKVSWYLQLACKWLRRKKKQACLRRPTAWRDTRQMRHNANYWGLWGQVWGCSLYWSFSFSVALTFFKIKRWGEKQLRFIRDLFWLRSPWLCPALPGYCPGFFIPFPFFCGTVVCFPFS